jgi:V-type H+-transporting ATPase subunit C
MFCSVAGFAVNGPGLGPIANWLQTQNSKQLDRAKQNLENKYSYLAGNAFGRDKKGRMQRDDPGEMHATGEGGAEYTPYVFYEFEFN